MHNRETVCLLNINAGLTLETTVTVTEVRAATPAINTETSTLSDVKTNQVLQQLPLEMSRHLADKGFYTYTFLSTGVTYHRNSYHYDTIGGRPDRISNGNLPAGERTINRWFDTSAFKIPGCPDSNPICPESIRTNVGRFGISRGSTSRSLTRPWARTAATLP